MQDQKQLLVHFSQDDSFLQTVPDPTVITLNHSVTWGSVGVRHFNYLPMEAHKHSSLEHAVMIHFQDEPALERSIDARYQQADIRTGEIFIVPANVNHSVVHTHEGEELIITLDPSLLAQSALEFADGERLELLPTLAQADSLLYGIGRALKSVLESSGQEVSALAQKGNRLYVDSLTTALSVHLLRNYCSRPQNVQVSHEGLPRYQLNQVLGYIQAHLGENIQLADLAKVIGLSRYYFLRLFKQSMGITPHHYLQQQRIEQAKGLLKQREMALADIALLCGFANQTHFTKSFRQRSGMTPKAYRATLVNSGNYGR